MKEPEMGAEIRRRGVGGKAGSFPEEGARAAHGVAEDVVFRVVTKLEDGGGQSLLKRGLDRAGAIASLKERSSGSINAEGGFIFIDEEVELNSGVVDLNGGALGGGFAEGVADGIFDDEAGEVGVAEGGVARDVSIDSKGFFKGKVILPGDFFRLGVESFAGGAFEVSEWP